MKSRFHPRGIAGCALLAALQVLAADSIPADTSGNAMLNGRYWVRQVVYALNIDTGKAGSANAITGAMTFDGKGNYTFTGQNLGAAKGTLIALTKNGTYRVGSNGVASLDSLLLGSDASEYITGAVAANGIFSGSATEGLANDLFVAIPAGAKILTNTALQGSFWIGHLDFPLGVPQNARNSLFQVTANGQGGFGPVTVTGRDATRNNTPLSQAVTGASYSFSSDGTASVTFPAPTGASVASALFGGTKTLYVSADGNYLLGGDPNGYDIYFGFRPLSGTTAGAAFKGVYYFASVDADTSDPANVLFLSEYGSINSLGNLHDFWHQRTSPFNGSTYDSTYSVSSGTAAPDGTLSTFYYRWVFGAGGSGVMIVGDATDYSLLVGFQAPTVTPSGVFLNPLGVFNSASYSPITNPISPGELITLFGANLANSTATATTLPFPSSLGGAQVMINGRPAPVYSVSPTQISAIVPFATSGAYATVQVINGATPSNTVTMYEKPCSPGIFAVPAVGDGYGAILHANFQLVTPANPAKQGETVLIFLTGLGAVNPPVQDGAPGPSSPLSVTTSSFSIDFGDTQTEAKPSFSGIAPGLAGLYQFNFQIPKNAPTGDVIPILYNDICQTYQVTIPIVAGP